MINDYRRSDFKKVSDKNGKKKYYFNCHGEFIEVTREVYVVFSSSYHKMKNDYRRDVNRSVTSYADLDKMTSFFVGFNDNTDWIDAIYLNDICAYVKEAISHLKPMDKLVAECIFLEGMNLTETSEMLGIAISTVQSKKKRIQKYLQDTVVNRML